MAEIKYEKKIDINDYSIKFVFYGTSKQDSISEKEIDDFLNEYFKNKLINFTMIDLVTLIRKVCRTLDETYLEVTIINDKKEFYERVLYDNTNLFDYRLEQKSEKINTIDEIEVNYNTQSGLSIFTGKPQNVKTNHETWLNTTKTITDEKINHLKKLEETKNIFINFDAKILIIIYRLFYKQNPNFCKAEDRIKAQLMIAFLKYIGNNIEDFYHFTLNAKKTMVTSQYLTQLIQATAPFGEIKEEFNNIFLDEKLKQKVSILGSELLKYMEKEKNPILWLNELVKIYYIKNYCLRKNATKEEIARYGNYTEENIENKLKLIKQIQTNYYKKL